MKKIFTLAIIAFMFSCSSDDSASSVPTSDIDDSGLALTPEARIEYNDSNFGLYKGIVVGSSGVVTVNLYNNDNVSATMIIDGVTYNFTTAEAITLDQNIAGLTFVSGNSSFDFNVSAGGLMPNISNLVIEGHPDANTEIIKEYSDALVRCYQGTFTGGDTGDFNLIRIENSLYGLKKPGTDEQSYWLQGQINSNLSIDGDIDGGTFNGYVNGATISGNWHHTGGNSGNWTGHRTL